jgi:hypothetical protein
VSLKGSELIIVCSDGLEYPNKAKYGLLYEPKTCEVNRVREMRAKDVWGNNVWGKHVVWLLARKKAPDKYQSTQVACIY